MNIFVFSGAGLSAESGVPTFRGTDGLWEGHRVEDVATWEGFQRDPATVHAFYNMRREKLKQIEPNPAHTAIARLQQAYVENKDRGEISLVTQNIDHLLERAGCHDVLHMHGWLDKCWCLFCREEMEWWKETTTDLLCPHCGKGGESGALRPAVVWFGEMPLYLPEIQDRLERADLFVSIGTSGLVYPAAGFVATAKSLGIETICFDLHTPENVGGFDCFIEGAAGETIPQWVEEILKSPS